MPAIVIPRKHYTQPQGRVDLSPEFNADYAYAPWMGASAVLGSDGPLFAQASMSAPLVSRGGIGTTYVSPSAATAGPTIDRYPFALAAAIEILPASGNVYAEAALGIGRTDVSSPAVIGVTSSFTGDARPCFRAGNQVISSSTSVHARISHIVAVAESATSRALYVNGTRVGDSAAESVLFQAGAPYIALHAVREYNYAAWNTTTSALRVLGGAWFKRVLSRSEAESLSANLWQLFRADPIRTYSFPTGPISISWSSLTASNITQTGARLTIGGITR